MLKQGKRSNLPLEWHFYTCLVHDAPHSEVDLLARHTPGIYWLVILIMVLSQIKFGPDSGGKTWFD